MAKRKRRKRTSSQVPAKGVLRDHADRLWSIAVRSDWNWTCAVCGSRSGQLDAHHLVPRGHEAVRYELRNGICLCPHDHKWNNDLAPHLNADGWVKWLVRNHADLYCWYAKNNDPPPKFDGIKSAAYYIGIIQGLREYVEPEEFERVVGVKFNRYLLGDASE